MLHLRAPVLTLTFSCMLQVKLIQLPAVPPNTDASSKTAQQELQLARKWQLPS